MKSICQFLLRPFNSIHDVLRSMGPSLTRVRQSVPATTLFDGKKFHNILPTSMLSSGSGLKILVRSLGKSRKIGNPQGTIPIHKTTNPVAEELAITWFGHASALIEIDGYVVLTDPIWSDRASPARFIGPKKLHPMAITLRELPVLDVVVISHDHYDHLDMDTIQYLARHQLTMFIVPLGIGIYLQKWGVLAERIIELEWGQSYSTDGLEIISTEARHFSGRSLVRDTTLWSSWVIATKKHRVFFGGDTGYTPAFKDIGERYGPFDSSLMPIGAYDKLWADIHLNPEEAIAAHNDLRGGLFIPIHWGTFNLAFHSWGEPIERLLIAADTSAVTVAIPQPGERIGFNKPFKNKPWWQALGITGKATNTQ